MEVGAREAVEVFAIEENMVILILNVAKAFGLWSETGHLAAQS